MCALEIRSALRAVISRFASFLQSSMPAQVEVFGLADGGPPLFFEVHEQLFPTMYTLWRLPHILPRLDTYSEVSPKVSSFALASNCITRFHIRANFESYMPGKAHLPPANKATWSSRRYSVAYLLGRANYNSTSSTANVQPESQRAGQYNTHF